MLKYLLACVLKYLFFLSPVKGGVDAKELFHLYIILWIQDKRLALLETCKLDKVHILSNEVIILVIVASFILFVGHENFYVVLHITANIHKLFGIFLMNFGLSIVNIMVKDAFKILTSDKVILISVLLPRC